VLPRLETGSLDAVICLAVLEHLWDAQEPLREFHRVLAPGGTLLVNVPSWRAKPVLEFVSFRLGLAADEMDDHKHYYDPRDLWPLLVEAGFMPSAIRCGRHNLGFGTFAVCRTPAA
jgi:SAM-dependent methyltransferase